MKCRPLATLVSLIALCILIPRCFLSDSSPFADPCNWQGTLEAPQTINTDALERRVQGWAFATPDIERIDIHSGTQRIASATLEHPRPDVRAQFSECRQPERSGFSMPLSLAHIPPGSDALRVTTVDTRGRRRLLGQIALDLSQPFASVDQPELIQLNGRNTLIGWALSKNGPVTVTIGAQDTTLTTLETAIQRQDVAALFKHWPGALQSGFEYTLSMHDLPRGRYPLQLTVADASGAQRQLNGPTVFNDRPLARVVTDEWHYLNPERIELAIWVWDEDPITSVQLTTQSGKPLGSLLPERSGVTYRELVTVEAKQQALSAAADRVGSVYQGTLWGEQLPDALSRLQVLVTDSTGASARYPAPLVLKQSPASHSCAGDAFRMLIPTSARLARLGLKILHEYRDLLDNGCVQVGLSGRVEYLRTTLGQAQDFRFNPDFPDALRIRKAGAMSTHALNELIGYALDWQVPLQVTLDGGPWADARFPAPDVDAVDWLEVDDKTVQWNQHGRPEADDALDQLPGAGENPQLARMMSLNRFNRGFLRYKKRNLQAAATVIGDALREHPELDVHVNLDPDEYINPWFYLQQWYDYNPDTLRQFREWLTASGPYADGAEWAAYQQQPVLTLKAINSVAQAHWSTLTEVEPPRDEPDYNDAWQQIWTRFKRHLVDLHYDQLAQWVVEAGLPAERVFTSQTFIQSDVAVSVDDPARGWTDQAGVSIEGARPEYGHLGVILYGPASRNEGSARRGLSLLDNIRAVDPRWGIVEYNPATIAFAEQLPTHTEAYQSLLQILNHEARFIVPMWGAHAADQVLTGTAFHSYEALPGSDFEYQLVWWLRKRQLLPVGDWLYPFGNAHVSSADGWSVEGAGTLETLPGRLRLPTTTGGVTVRSPQLRSLQALAGRELMVQGIWHQQATLSMQWITDQGRSVSVPLLADANGRLRGQFPERLAATMGHIALHWRLPARAQQQPVEVDEVVIRQRQ